MPAWIHRRVWLLASLSVIPLLVWWLGWFPGFLSSDSFDQLRQAEAFEFRNFHPAFHTLYLWLVTRVWDSPGAVTLVQVLLMAGLLSLVAQRLADVGVNPWVAAGSAWVVAALPAVSTTTIAVWKDVPYTLALVWAFAELLAATRDPDGYWRGRASLRLGGALALVWLFRHNGFVTVVVLAAVLAVVFRDRWRRLLPAAGVVVAAVVAVQMVLYPLLDVRRASIEPAEVLVSDVAASLRHEPGNFSADELAYLATIAPLDVWTDRYRCEDSTPLVFAPDFDASVIRDDPGRFRSLAVRSILRDLDTTIGHRWCAASYLFVPAQPKGAYFHRPPFAIAANALGITREPVVQYFFQTTKSVFVWAEPSGRLWLTWRPALAVWAALLTYAAVAYRRSLRRLLLPAALIVAQGLNVAVTTPAQEFRFAFGIYVMALLSVPLLWLAARPSEAALVGAEVDGGSLDHPRAVGHDVANGEPGGAEEDLEAGGP